MFEHKNRIIVFCTEEARTAARILQEELRLRGVGCGITNDPGAADIRLQTAEYHNLDAYRIHGEDRLIFSAEGTRGLIFAIGRYLRKTEYRNGEVRLVADIRGEYHPRMPVRGHQLGYRPTANSYEAWDEEQYRRYYLDMMYFGANTAEHIPEYDGSERNALMKYSSPQMCAAASRIAQELDLDISLWMPNYETDDGKALQLAEPVFADAPRINAVFIPGSDPGDLPADALFRRAGVLYGALKKYHPDAKIWISAQMPHGSPDWGDAFISQIETLPEFVGGVIQGPNRAMELDELRKRVPDRYPIRLYPDITHNVRCEYPVHFPTDDWHYAWATTLSRESVNPRPKEMRRIHRLTRPYIIGSVSYSEGVNDDLNKMIWSDMDWFGETDLRESVADYVRLFFPGSDVALLTDAIFGLEENWESAPEESVSVTRTYEKWLRAGEENPALYQNWRYVMHLFRACCDELVRERRIFETDLIAKARAELDHGDVVAAEQILKTDFPACYTSLRNQIEEHAEALFRMIGLQTDVERYGAKSWERGAVLETIDLPVTNRAYYLRCFENAPADPKEKSDYMIRVFDRTKTESGAFYYSVAEHGLECANCPQEGYPYMNFRGDNPRNNGKAPMEILKVFDNYTFRIRTGGFDPACDYEMRVVYLSHKKENVTRHTVRINGSVIYCGPQFGPQDPDYDQKYLTEGFESAVYHVPGGVFANGCAEIELSEPTMGVMFSEIMIRRKEETA